MIFTEEISQIATEVIVPITNENIDECVPVYMKAYNCMPWNHNWTFAKAKEYLTEYMNCGSFVGFALYAENSIVAATFAHTKTWWTDKQLMIDEFFVTKEKQRQGYGKLMMRHCDEYAATHHIQSVLLMTNKYMPSYRFYEKDNYITVEQYVFMFKHIPSDC